MTTRGYYAAPGSRTRRMALQDFHNEIKLRLLRSVVKVGDCALLDLGVGRAGDLQKWRRTGVSFACGVDRDPACLEEARRRVERARPQMRVRLLLADCSRRGGLREVDWSWFDVVSCQFTLHYMLESERSLMGFLWNAAAHCRTGGALVGTCFDGASVRRLLRDIANGETVEWSDDDGTFCEIAKRYEERERAKMGDYVGDAIDVWMRPVGGTHREWLVDFDEVFVPWMRHVGFELEETRSFSEEADGAGRRGSARDMTSSERRVSFLNRSFVFRRRRQVWMKKVFWGLR